MPEFIRNNAGKAFEFMVEKVNEDRKAAGLGTVEEAFAGEGRGEKGGFGGKHTPLSVSG